jgi:DNA repair protein RadA/Sms
MVEEVVREEKETRGARVSLDGSRSKPLKLDEVELRDYDRVKTKMDEFNRVLGGGVVPGSLVLLGGDPGIGKSTLLLQVSKQLSYNGRVLYVSGEESAIQIKLRSDRLEDQEDDFYLYSETNIQDVKMEMERLKPDFVIIDSIQTMLLPDIDSIPGTVSQIRSITAELLMLAKTNEIAIFIVGHVTKEGNIAGPRMLEHMVDTVLYFEGERSNSFRILRAVKNRFGSTNEIGIFEMDSNGLMEVTNPSDVFLEERMADSHGSAVVCAMEGSRPILVEVQALMVPTLYGNAKRTTAGLDYNRSSLILAVLEKRASLMLQNHDAYLKSAGGVKLTEPAIDLAIAMAIASSYDEKETKPGDCFIGEIGLTGEIRRVPRIDQRITEASKLGFKRVFIPKNNALKLKIEADIEIIPITTIAEAIQLAFAG